MVTRHVALMVLALCASAACSKEITPATQVIVEIQADALLQTQLSSITIDVDGSRGREAASYVDRFEYEVTRASGALRWPFVFPLAPLDDDAARTYRVVVTGQAADGKTIIARALSGYVANETRTLRLYLASSCVGVTCEAIDTCIAGVCSPATIEPTNLPQSATPDAATPDAATPDAATPNDAEADADVPDGGVADASLDAAIDPCEGALSATPTWTVETAGTAFEVDGPATFLDAVAVREGLIVLSTSTASATLGHLLLSRETAAGWSSETVASSDSGDTGAVALDASGDVFVAYASEDRNHVYLSRKVGGLWTTRTTFVGENAQVYVYDLYIHTDGQAHVLYQRGDGSIWKSIFSVSAATNESVSPTSPSSQGWYFLPTADDPDRLAVDRNSYGDNVFRWSGTQWSTVWGSRDIGTTATQSRIVGIPGSFCVAATESSSFGRSPLKIFCSTPETEESIDEGSQQILQYDRRNDRLHLLYHTHGVSPRRIRHAVKRGGTWTSSTVIEAAEIPGWSSSSTISAINECGVFSALWYEGPHWRLARYR